MLITQLQGNLLGRKFKDEGKLSLAEWYGIKTVVQKDILDKVFVNQETYTIVLTNQCYQM